MVHRDVYFERDEMLQAHPAPRFDGRVVVPGTIPTRGEHTEQVIDAIDANGEGLWLWHFASRFRRPSVNQRDVYMS
ncbi:hypothetical protein D3C81_2076810 [compost metagenome]